MDDLPKSATIYTLQALIPYSRANIKLVFKPNQFFADLEKIDRYSKPAYRNAFYRSIKRGLITIDETGIPRLTEKGLRKVRPFTAKRLGRKSVLMITFDIPELHKAKRQHLRLLLKELGFTQAQKSVWTSEYDHRFILLSEVEQYGLQEFVRIYEAAILI